MERLIEDPVGRSHRGLPFNDGTRSTIRARRIWTRSALAAFAAAVGLLVAGVSTAAAAPAATAAPTSQCWLQVVNDWLNNNRVDGVYAIPCYTQAIQHLNAYPDVKNYSSATDDIQRALLAAIRQDRGNGPGAGPGSGPTGDPSSGPGNGSTPTSNGPKSTGFIGSFSPSDAQSVPLPLLVLGGLALLLLLAAAVTLIARRVQARRGPPMPVRPSTADKRG